MTDHDKKISGVEAPLNPVQQQSAPSEGRRRLMKGALAAPAVMTLMHGRLAAAMSAVCTDKLPMIASPQDGITWVDASGNPLTWSTDEDGNDVLEDDTGEVVTTYTSGSCWASLGPLNFN